MGALWETRSLWFLQSENLDLSDSVDVQKDLNLYNVCTFKIVPYAGNQLIQYSLHQHTI